MAIPKKKKKLFILAGIALILIGLAGGIFYFQNPSANPISMPSDRDYSEPTPEADKKVESLPKNTQPSPSQTAKLDTPVLIKSSGNNGPVPAGAVIEFVCSTKAGYDCKIILTNKADTKNVIDLGNKPAQADNRGSAGATWNWTAIKGSWNVLAEASFQGIKASSPTQNLEVN